MTITEYNDAIKKHTNKIIKHTKESGGNIKILIKPKKDAYDIHRKLFNLESNVQDDAVIKYKKLLNKPIEVYSKILYWDKVENDKAYLVSTHKNKNKNKDSEWMIFLCQIEKILNITDNPEYFL